MQMLSTGMTSESAWNDPALVQHVWEWFNGLSLEERMQAIAIEDPVWIRLYLLLFTQEHRRKDRSGSSNTVKREKVTLLYQRLSKRETSKPMPLCTVSSSASSCMAPSSNGAHGEVNEVDGADVAKKLGEDPILNLMPGDEVRRKGSFAGEEEDEEDEGEDDEALCAELRAAAIESFSAAELDVASRRAGDLLHRHVRLCTVASPLDTMTLCGGLLEDATDLKRLLCVITKNAFLSKPMAATTIKAFASATPALGTPQSPPPEAPWLQDRPSGQQYPLRDLLVNRLEVSLWIGFWRRIQKSSVPRSPAFFKTQKDKARRLLAFADKLDPAKRLALFDGLRVAQRMLQQTSHTTGKDRAQVHGQVMENLLLIPITWAYKDEGAAVGRVLDRVQTACADCVASELLADESTLATLQADPLEAAAARASGGSAKKSKKKKRKPVPTTPEAGGRAPHATQQQQQQQQAQPQVQQQQQEDEEEGARPHSGPAPESSEQPPLQDGEDQKASSVEENSENMAPLLPLGRERKGPATGRASSASPSTEGTGRGAKLEEEQTADEEERCWEKVGPRGRGRTRRPSLPSNWSQAVLLSSSPLPPSPPVPPACSKTGGSSPPLQGLANMGRAESKNSVASAPSCLEKVGESGPRPRAVSMTTSTSCYTKEAPPNTPPAPELHKDGSRQGKGDEGEGVAEEGEEDGLANGQDATGTPSSPATMQQPQSSMACRKPEAASTTMANGTSHTTPVRPVTRKWKKKEATRGADGALSRVDGAADRREEVTWSGSQGSRAGTAQGKGMNGTRGGDREDVSVPGSSASSSSSASIGSSQASNGRAHPNAQHQHQHHHQRRSGAGSQQAVSPLSSASSSPQQSPNCPLTLSPVDLAQHLPLPPMPIPLPPPHQPLPPHPQPHHHHAQPRRCRPHNRPAPLNRPLMEAATGFMMNGSPVPCSPTYDGRLPGDMPRGMMLPLPSPERGLRSEQVEKHRRIRDARDHAARAADFRRGQAHQQPMPQPCNGVLMIDPYLSALSPEQHARVLEFAKDMEVMRQLLTVNVEAFMAKREVDMRAQRAQRKLVMDEISSIVGGLWSDARVELYGSCFTGLDLPSSDVDVVVCGLPNPSSLRKQHPASHPSSPEDHRATPSPLTVDRDTGAPGTAAANGQPVGTPRGGNGAAAHEGVSANAFPRSPRHSEVEELSAGGRGFFLHQLAAALESKPWVRSMKTIDTAFIPVIKLLADPAVLGATDSCGLVPIDISLEGPHHGGIASSLFIRDMIQPGGPYHHGVPLTLLLKTLMSQRGLNTPWGGGLSSYALMLMVITLLQQFETPEMAEAQLWSIRRSVDAIRQKLHMPATCKGPKLLLAPPLHPPSPRAPNGLPDPPPPSGRKGKNGHGKSPATSPSAASTPACLWAHFLATGRPPALLLPGMAMRGASPSAGYLLTYFFEYYGRIFSPSNEGIAVDRGFGLTFPLAGVTAVPDPLTIVDPLDESVNVSRCCFRIGEIQWIFSQCLQLLELKGTEMARKAKLPPGTQPPPQGTPQHTPKASGEPPASSQVQVSTPQGEGGSATAPCPAEVNILGLIMSY